MSDINSRRGSKMSETSARTRATMTRWIGTLACAVALLSGAAVHASQTEFAPRPSAILAAQPPLPSSGVYPLQLVLDDNTDEGSFGVTAGVGAQQFMWFNRFSTPSAGYRLQQIWVLFPSGTNLTAGAPVQLAVYLDTDANPANGAPLAATFNATVQVADDINFSVYNLPQPITVGHGQDVLVGVIPRFIVSGTTPPTNPAAVDTTASQGRSWVAVWSGDPPDPPTLPPDALIARLDDGLLPGGGNWMIRAFGAPLATQGDAVPALNVPGALAAIATLIATGLWHSRRRKRVRVVA
jgi:hypothetical protein